MGNHGTQSSAFIFINKETRTLDILTAFLHSPQQALFPASYHHVIIRSSLAAIVRGIHGFMKEVAQERLFNGYDYDIY